MIPGRLLEIASATTIATVGLAAFASWAGAFVTRQLLKAVARRAEGANAATGSITQLSD